MNGFFEEVKEKGKYLATLSGLKELPEDAMDMFNGIKKKIILSQSKKDLKSFYSDKNFVAIDAMIKADELMLSGNINIVDLNFFPLYLEMQTQKALYTHFPEAFNTKISSRYILILDAVNSLQSKVLAAIQKHGLQNVYNTALKKANSDIKAYSDVLILLK